jgi:hypothetical protein
MANETYTIIVTPTGPFAEYSDGQFTGKSEALDYVFSGAWEPGDLVEVVCDQTGEVVSRVFV